jgi:hypothetical protein
MSKTNTGLVAFAKAALDAKLGYVYGTFGQVCTAALLDQKAKQYPANNLAGGAMRTVGNKWLNRRVVDCSGLIKYYLMANAVGDNPTYNAKYDTNLFNVAAEKGPISTLPEIPGICLYMTGHTAVYLGNGIVIEAAGTAYGVVQSKLPNCHTGRAWTHWYKAPGITYLKTESIPAKTKTTSATLRADTSGIITVKKGAYYQLRTFSAAGAQVTSGNPASVVIVPRNIARGADGAEDWFLVPIGDKGSQTGIYISNAGDKSGKQCCIVKIG